MQLLWRKSWPLILLSFSIVDSHGRTRLLVRTQGRATANNLLLTKPHAQYSLYSQVLSGHFPKFNLDIKFSEQISLWLTIMWKFFLKETSYIILRGCCFYYTYMNKIKKKCLKCTLTCLSSQIRNIWPDKPLQSKYMHSSKIDFKLITISFQSNNS